MARFDVAMDGSPAVVRLSGLRNNAVQPRRSVEQFAMRYKGELMIGFWKYLIPQPKVLFATSELGPLIKTGGLADVSASLPAALAQLGCDIRVVMPGYGAVLRQVPSARSLCRVRLGPYEVEILETTVSTGFPVLLVCSPTLFGREGDPYLGPDGRDWDDNADRFALFSRAVAWLAEQDQWGGRPNILHLNDWQTGLVGAFLAGGTPGPCIVFSIHNLSYQGLFDFDTFSRLGLPMQLWSYDALEFHGQLSFIKGGIGFADGLTTVSPTYAREIQTPDYGAGLDGLLRFRSQRLQGILNGIDTEVWNPARDRLIPSQYDAERLAAKAGNKAALQQEFGLVPGKQPLFAMISRLVHQKGVDLLVEALPTLLELQGQLVVLGSGDAAWQQVLQRAADAHAGQVGFNGSRDERLAHLVEAGADIFLMPSRFEPCGLNQMYSMRYGTVPIARRTGGLADTVTPIDDGLGKATGFLFDEPSGPALARTMRTALRLYRNPDVWQRLQRNGMATDFSWHVSAERYLALYRDLLTSAEIAGLDTDGRASPNTNR
jgi:starch synthase